MAGNSTFKLVCINSLVLGILLIATNLLCGFVLSVLPDNKQTSVYQSPVFEDQATAEIVFREMGVTKKDLYRSFTGWTLKPFEGKFITINEEGFRQHPHQLSITDAIKTVGFFGGSTAWGYGTADHQTLPAYLDAMNNRFRVINKGQPGYNARQELVSLIDAYAHDAKFDYVIFYDGVNEVLLCEKGLNETDHMRTNRHRERIMRKDKTSSPRVILHALEYFFIGKTLQLAKRLNAPSAEEVGASFYDCELNHEKAVAIAAYLIENWKIAHKLVTAHGGKFVGILQPQIFTGEPNKDYFNDEFHIGRAYLEQQYLTVYPEIKKLLDKEKLPFIYDLTHSFNRSEAIYFDFCHVGPTGNLIMAEEINDILINLN